MKSIRSMSFGNHLRCVIFASFLSYLLLVFVLYLFLRDNYVEWGLWNLNIIIGIAFYLLLCFLPMKRVVSEKTLFVVVLMFNVFVLVAYGLYIPEFYGGYSYSAVDSFYYDYTSREMAKLNASEWLGYVLRSKSIDDVGYNIFLAIVYKYFSVNVFVVNIVEVVVVSFVALLVYRISLYYLEKNAALISAIAFSASSYFIYYNIAGLKEIVLLLLVVAVFYYYFEYMKGVWSKIYYVLLLLLLIVGFRLIVVMYIVASLLIVEVIRDNKSFVSLVFVVVFGLVGIGLYLLYANDIMDKYMRFGVEEYVAMASVRKGAGLTNTVNASIISAFFGPFPTIIPDIRNSIYMDSSIRASGMIFYLYMKLYFYIGVIRGFYEKNYNVMALSVFVMLLVITVIIRTVSFDLRYVIVGVPFIVSIGLYGYKGIENKYKKISVLFLLPIVFVIVFLWNYLRVI